MPIPIIVNVKKAELIKRDYVNFRNWNEDDGHLYIGRCMEYFVLGTKHSKWHNPFSLKKYPIEESLKLYEERIIKNLYDDLDELLGYKELGCWCKPRPCHGDVLLKLLKIKMTTEMKYYKKLSH
jgi:hypothetical protein